MQCPSCQHDNPPEASFCANCGAALAPTVESSTLDTAPTPAQVQPATGVEYVGFWTRFAAWIIDSFIILIIMIITIVATMFVGFVGILVILLLPWLYYWLFTGLQGQTLGKKAVGIKVVDGQGDIPGLGRAALREVVGKVISSIPFFLGFFWIGWDSRKQGWHDKLAGTYVVRSRRD